MAFVAIGTVVGVLRVVAPGERVAERVVGEGAVGAIAIAGVGTVAVSG